MNLKKNNNPVWVAARGIAYAIQSQRHMKIHTFAGIGAVILAIWLHLSSLEWLILSLTITQVFVAEMLNTAIELSVDLVTKKSKLRAMLSKDVAAGAVLLASFQALIVATVLFGPKLISHLGDF